MQSPQKETVLQTGRTIYCLDEREAALVHEQVEMYFDHGIQVEAGDTIFDVGANIGLFTLFAYERAEGNLNAFAFEPIPETYSILSANFARVDDKRLKAYCCGISDTEESAVFTFYPRHTTLSTAFWDPENEREMREQLRLSVARNMDEVSDSVKDSYPLFRLLFVLPKFARQTLINWLTWRSFNKAEKLTCQLRKLSNVIKEQKIKRIDLLKVDVEKSELGVLEGIDSADWQKIKQVVMEIHDLDNRVSTIRKMLERHGLNQITVEQELALQGSNVYSLFARRTSAASSLPDGNEYHIA